MKYAIRIPANDSAERDIAELLPRPVGRNGVSAQEISRLESKIASALEKGVRFDYSTELPSLLKTGDLLATLVSLGEKISRIAGH